MWKFRTIENIRILAEPCVPRASIVWLARAVKVERPLSPRVSTIDRARFARGDGA